ncbi:DUF4173 domain-containing protein [Bradyrhizobium prioriisuperbiae]|uniref:DUF4153 domain-containing protein n=1 Tax=Bradyrhizobium prioriisuperbiae TaxID=2854389 RepID=UPI0028ED202D|nr:DUF4173 domain-containing protein [Bradyrhizobium prioritasuperba]
MKILSLEPFVFPLDLGRPTKLAVALGVVTLADWLFYDRAIGLSLALFLLALVGAALMANRMLVDWHRAGIIAALLTAALLPLVEDLNAISAIFGILGVALVVSALTNPFAGTLAGWLTSLRPLLLTGPFRLIPDLLRMRPRSLQMRLLTVWVVPILLSCLFLGLFVAANPLIEYWISIINLSSTTSYISGPRLLFWFAVASIVWPLIATRWRRTRSRERRPDVSTIAPGAGFGRDLFGPAAILRSLVLFNLLFAVQTLSDLTYLWGGAALPDGMTYATYAHNGAYPLIVTALLAAAFILAATSNEEAQRSPLIRALVFVWTGQNVLLVISSMLRLDLYVEIYALTYWRVAAFIWMGLVAIGLVLIVARMAFDQSNRWLILANLSALALVMYICAFVNFPAVIANYNVAHSQEVSGKGVVLDFDYLMALGPQALPALDTFNQRGVPGPGVFGADQRAKLAAQLGVELRSWRAWSFRKWRLQRYLDHRARHMTAS